MGASSNVLRSGACAVKGKEAGVVLRIFACQRFETPQQSHPAFLGGGSGRIRRHAECREVGVAYGLVAVEPCETNARQGKTGAHRERHEAERQEINKISRREATPAPACEPHRQRKHGPDRHPETRIIKRPEKKNAGVENQVSRQRRREASQPRQPRRRERESQRANAEERTPQSWKTGCRNV